MNNEIASLENTSLDNRKTVNLHFLLAFDKDNLSSFKLRFSLLYTLNAHFLSNYEFSVIRTKVKKLNLF